MERHDADRARLSSALRPVDRESLHEVIAERLLSHIIQSDLRPGDRLPGERALSKRLGVSRTSLRKATVALQTEGVLEVRHGGGTFLRHLDPDTDAVATILERRRLLPEIFEARRALETPIAALAAQRRTEADLSAIDAGLALMRSEIAAGEIGLKGDAAFHKAVTNAAHSPVFSELMRSLAQGIVETRGESLSQPQRPRQSLADHERIAHAIRGADPAAAAAAMREHIDHVGDIRLLEWEPEEFHAAMTDSGDGGG